MLVAARLLQQPLHRRLIKIMSWPKPNTLNIIKPPVKLNRGRWFLFFIVLFIITCLILAAIWPSKNFHSQWMYWAVATFIPTLIGGSAFGIRLYLYGLSQEEYEIWQQEQQKVDQNWQKWAMQSLVVLDSYYSIPTHITSMEIYSNASNIDSQVNKSLEFEGDVKAERYIEDLFFAIKDTLIQLPSTEHLDIKVLSSPDSFSYIDQTISHAYKNAQISLGYNLSHQILQNTNIENLIENIDSSQPGVQLIIINNAKSNGSAFVAAFLLTNKTYYQELNISFAKSEILRPMISNDLTTDLKQMVDMQCALEEINQLWFTNIDSKEKINIIKQLADYQIVPEHLYMLEIFVGNQTELSYWLALALACEMITITNQNNLIASQSMNQKLLSVVKGM
ncbi:hypothetical protein J3U44_05590 [Gilliamella sp. B3766]|uniref:hypothetical protein n=1 Tax=unclassified Gilliamella TaxID=2685620 RepID=UPI00226A3DB4|nr:MULTISPECIES: hypothetical protein [unclassified Gilliamella]MCX8610572.1 hypothetical protein [Gilliamella sp. B3891]MCX8620014.1 hypothetical protein [Gilliamella sp. B3892]MCX8628836.1 hypothetical protein [Gilliamella sp. B3976]MCX8632470.1 hypothetical protein [Gilliamella sp. B3927]MCX8607239.1 hypothetical protein [Gilliamella sp. B3771]